MIPPRVSIIIPCYHAERHIEQCVQSILDQTYQDWEAIFIVDGFESDRTALMIHNLSITGWKESLDGPVFDKRFIISTNTGKSSPAKARNKGLSMAVGEYITFLDADDWWEPEKLCKQVHYMDDHPATAWCWSYAIHHRGVRAFSLKHLWDNQTPDVMIPFQSIMMRQSLVNKMGTPLFDESLEQIDDYDLYLRLKEYPAYEFREALVHYREHAQGITTSSSRAKIATMQLQININRRQWRGIPYMFQLAAEYQLRSLLLPYKNAVDNFISSHRLKGAFLQIEPTTACNLNCEKCVRDTDMPVVHITPETLNRLIDKHEPVDTILLQGLGEPFMHPHFGKICKLAKSRCRFLATVTNGTLIWKHLDALDYLDHIVVSIDNIGQNDRKEEVIELLKEGKSCAVNFVRTAENFHQEKPLREWCEDVGVLLHVTPVQNWYNPEEPEWQAAHEAVLAERQLSGKKDKPFRDHCPFLDGRKVYYDARGIRHPCCTRMRYSQEFPTMGTCRSCPE